MNYYLLIIPIAILAMFVRVMFLNRNPKIEIEPEKVVNESEFYDDNLD